MTLMSTVSSPGGNCIVGSVSVRLNKGNGFWSPETSYGIGSSPRRVYPADLDNDGDYELVVASCDNGNVYDCWE